MTHVLAFQFPHDRQASGPSFSTESHGVTFPGPEESRCSTFPGISILPPSDLTRRKCMFIFFGFILLGPVVPRLCLLAPTLLN